MTQLGGTSTKWGGQTRKNFDVGSPSPSSGTLETNEDAAPPTKSEIILFQAMADYERETDPKELYEILDL